MFRSLMVACLVTAIVATGCRVSTQPRIVSTFEVGETPRLRQAPRRGEFILYRVEAATEADRAGKISREFVIRCMLGKSERLGFTRGLDGRVFAVGGGVREPIDSAFRHQWVMKADPGQLDVGKTAALVGVIALGVVVLGIIMVADAWSDFGDDFATGPGFAGRY